MLLELVQTLDFLLEKMFSWLLLSVWFVLDQEQRASREIENQDVIIFYTDGSGPTFHGGLGGDLPDTIIQAC